MDGNERVEVVRGRMTPEIADELIAFWAEHGALGEAAARERIPQVICVLRDAEGRIAGVNSAFADRVELVAGRRFWIYRSFLGSGSGDAWPAMVDAAFAALAEGFDPEADGPIGMCVPIRDRAEMARRPEAAWE